MKGIAFPLIFSLLPKRGNPQLERTQEDYGTFYPSFRSGMHHRLVADREFIGRNGQDGLNSRFAYGITFEYVRISGLSSLPTGERIRAWWLFNDLKVGQEKFFHKLFLHKGEYVYLAGSRIKKLRWCSGIADSHMLQSAEEAILTYKKRWEIRNGL